MERPYTGLTALIKINGAKIGYLNSVELSLEKDVIEILQFGAQYREKVPAIKNWTASSEGTVAFAAGESQHKLYQAYESGELVELEIMLDDVTNFSGKALVSSLSISGAPDDALNISVEFEGSGATTFTLPQTFFVDISSGVGGTTEPAGNIRVVADNNLEITVIPATGKKASGYYLDKGTELTKITDNKISITKITQDHSINVVFEDDNE